jgi:lipoprotein-anchoring transpeptidase ErfK/SrfK
MLPEQCLWTNATHRAIMGKRREGDSSMRFGFIATILLAVTMGGAALATTTDSSNVTVPVVKPPSAPATTNKVAPAATAKPVPATTSKATTAKPAAKATSTTTKKSTTAKTTKPSKKATASKTTNTNKKKVAARPKEPYVVITINKSTQKMTVAVGGQKTYTWLVSTGGAGYTTPSGNFKPFRMERDHFSKEWDDAPMPYSIFFTGEGHAIHGSPYTKRLGTRASHGCVRLATENAATLFALVQKAGMSNTRVIVKNGGFDWFTSSIDTDYVEPTTRWMRKVDPLEKLNKIFDE